MTPAYGRSRRSTGAILAAVVLTLIVPLAASGAPPARPAPFVSSTISGAIILPLINSGDTRNGVTFEGIPDGLGIAPVGDGDGQIDIFVAFEQSHVPFGGFADFEDSSVQRVRLNLDTLRVTQLKEMLPPSAGFIRFCSAFMAGPAHGFDEYTFLVNEESNDVIEVVPGATYGADPFLTPYRQAGYSVYLDTKSGDYQHIPSLGRYNHENTVVVPGGWDELATLSSDDTFTATTSQLYLYTAADSAAFKDSDGTLWAFRVTGTDGTPLADPTDPFNGANDYLDMVPGDDWQGEFISVPKNTADGTTAARPQDALETWSNANNVFQFVRVEDIASDPDNPRVVYFTDTGSARIQQDPATGRMFRPAADGWPFFDSDGRLFRMILNEDDPTVVDSFSIVAQGKFQRVDELLPPTTPRTGVTTVLDPGVGFVNPDNLDVGHNSIMVQEDASSANDVWQYTLDAITPTWTRVASTTQVATAETSGIIDASAWIGPGWWVLDVQSHVNQALGPAGLTYQPLPSGTPITYQTRREQGQLLLMYIPGS
jgi:Bacterial protein of unknown function (DUF839)